MKQVWKSTNIWCSKGVWSWGVQKVCQFFRPPCMFYTICTVCYAHVLWTVLFASVHAASFGIINDNNGQRKETTKYNSQETYNQNSTWVSVDTTRHNTLPIGNAFFARENLLLSCRTCEICLRLYHRQMISYTRSACFFIPGVYTDKSIKY